MGTGATASAFDIAAHIKSRLGSTDRWALQKLTYYVQAWSLVWRGRPAFNERIEAWRDGPVVRDLQTEMNYGRGLANARPLSPDDAAHVDRVLLAYSKFDSRQLIELTHEEEPWLDARGDLSRSAYSSAEITQEAIKAYYTRQWTEAEEDRRAIESNDGFEGTVDELFAHLGIDVG